jgi:hypothetical protein
MGKIGEQYKHRTSLPAWTRNPPRVSARSENGRRRKKIELPQQKQNAEERGIFRRSEARVRSNGYPMKLEEATRREEHVPDTWTLSFEEVATHTLPRRNNRVKESLQESDYDDTFLLGALILTTRENYVG